MSKSQKGFGQNTTARNPSRSDKGQPWILVTIVDNECWLHAGLDNELEIIHIYQHALYSAFYFCYDLLTNNIPK